VYETSFMAPILPVGPLAGSSRILGLFPGDSGKTRAITASGTQRLKKLFCTPFEHEW